MKLLNVGYGNMVCCERIICVVSPDAAPIKRMVAQARETGRAIDASCGKRTRSVIFTDSDHLILSALDVDKINNRLSGKAKDTDDEVEDDE